MANGTQYFYAKVAIKLIMLKVIRLNVVMLSLMASIVTLSNSMLYSDAE
jgi:hypothetical protein